MRSIFWIFFLASLVHLGEEYFFPGGFMQFMRRFNPRWAAAVNVPFAVIVNSAFLVLVLAGAWLGESALLFSLSIAALLFINGMIHLAGAIITRHYVPGLISSLLLFIPLSTTAFIQYLCTGLIDLSQIALAFLIGLLYQLIPPILMAAGSRRAA
jgi:hypothetical protein